MKLFALGDGDGISKKIQPNRSWDELVKVWIGCDFETLEISLEYGLESESVMRNMVSVSALWFVSRVALHFSCNSWLSKVDVSHSHHAQLNSTFLSNLFFNLLQHLSRRLERKRSVYVWACGPWKYLLTRKIVFNINHMRAAAADDVRWTRARTIEKFVGETCVAQAKLNFNPHIIWVMWVLELFLFRLLVTTHCSIF